jgi:RecB family endonuclease NucS
VDALLSPSLEQAREAVKRAVEAGCTCLLVAECRVRYKGRASSELGPGQRLVVLKQDGSVLVHRPFGREPVNWQPSGSIVSTELVGGRLVVRVARVKPHEELVVEVSRVDLVAWGRLVDESELAMYGSEEELRDALVENPSVIEPGLKPVEVERKTRAGFVDALFLDSRGELVVVEVKRGTAGVDAVLQLKRYVEALKRELGVNVRGMLVAERLARGARGVLAKEGLEFKRVDPKALSRAKRSARLI